MKIIALEEHIVSKPITEATAGAVAAAYPYHEAFLHPAPADKPDVAELFRLGEQRLAIMDKVGIDMEVVSYTNASQWLTGEEAATLTTQANDGLAAATKPYPERFRAFATLPWANVEQAGDELKRCVSELGFVGALISGRPLTSAVFLDDARFDPMWQVFTDLDVPLYIHPNFTCKEVCGAYYSGLGEQVDTILSAYGWGWHLEAGIQVLRMILADVFERFPTLKIISGHWGEVLPYYLSRLDQMLPPAVTKLPQTISTYYRRNVWVTPSGVYDDACLEFCLKKLGSDHILYSTDFPYLSEEGARSFIEKAPISEADKLKISSENARKLLRID